MTEQTETNPEVLQDLPPVHPASDPQTDIAPPPPVVAEHPAVAENSQPPSGVPEQERDGVVAASEPAAEANVTVDASAGVPSDSDGADREAVAESVVRIKTAEPARPAKARPARKSAAATAAVAPEVPKSENMNWYILKVQSNREESIREGLLRRVSIQGLDRFFGEVIVPTEKVTEFKGGKKRVIKRKLYPGYIVVHMEINEDTWFLVRETPGIGDFTGASGVPTPMLPHEVDRIIAKQEEKSEKAPDLKIPFTKGDRVKVIEGNFENFEGEVDAIDKTNGRVTVMITIFNRTTPVEFEYWQVESV